MDFFIVLKSLKVKVTKYWSNKCTLGSKTIAEAVLMRIYNLCFGSKIRKIGIPLQTPVFMPPTSKKLRGHIGLGLSVQSVSLSVSLSVCDA